MATNPRTYLSVHGATAEHVKVTGAPDQPTLRIGGPAPAVEIMFDSHGDLVAFGAEIMRQGRLAAATAAQARAVRLADPVLGGAS